MVDGFVRHTEALDEIDDAGHETLRPAHEDVAAVEPSEAWLEGLDDALADLPDDQRQAIGLRVLADLSYDDVAVALHTTPGAVRVRVHRGLAALRSRLQLSKEEA